MAVKDALLALLGQGPRYGYQLKAEFEQATGERWPLNIGQVYSTLQRLTRDELVDTDGPADDEGRQSYVLTEQGHASLSDWLAEPAQAAGGTRDELTMKILITVATDPGAALAAVDHQRTVAMSNLQALTALKAEALGDDIAQRLQLDRTVLLAESEIRWLDLTEQRLEAAGFTRQTAPLPGRLSPKESS